MLDKYQIAALARHGATEADTQPKQNTIEEQLADLTDLVTILTEVIAND